MTVLAQVHNYGGTEAQNVLVAMYEGDPAQGGQLIDQSTLSALAPLEGAQVAFATTFATRPSRVRVDLKQDEQVLARNEA